MEKDVREHWESSTKPIEYSNQRRRGALGALRELLEIIRDYGMPTTAFGAGIYAFILVLQVEMAPEFKAGIALVLTTFGLLAQLWVYSRENPRVQSDEVRHQLSSMTRLVEHLVEMSLRSGASEI